MCVRVCVAAQNPLKCVFQLKKFSTLENFRACAKIFYANAIRQWQSQQSERDTAKQKENPYRSPYSNPTATETESATESAASNIRPATKPNEK